MSVVRHVAKISVVRIGEMYRITVAGRFSARDLKRLERACHDALEHQHVPIELNLAKVLTIDPAARAYLDRLRARGASFRGGHEADASHAE